MIGDYPRQGIVKIIEERNQKLYERRQWMTRKEQITRIKLVKKF